MKSRASEVFVGRVLELRELEQALDAVRAGRGATVLVAGDAGIGKTRLASELARRARQSGFEVLIGRSIDLVGTELPYQPFVDALRPLGEPRQLDRSTGSQRRVFEDTLALLTDRAAHTPVLLVLEDLHWADTSTLDLVVFLAHNVDNRRLLLLVTYRADEPSSAERMRQLAEGVRRSGAEIGLVLGPLEEEELAALLAAHADAPLPASLTDAIVARAEGNPFFAEELVAAAAHESGELPLRLRDLLLQRVSRLDGPTQSLLQLAAAVGRDVAYSLLCTTATLTERDVRTSLRHAVEHGVLVADQATGSFRFRHSLLAEAIYATILPGEREELHARLADALARDGARPAELALHWGRQVAPPRRCPPQSKRRAKRRPSAGWPRLVRTSSGYSSCGLRCRPQPSSHASTWRSSARGQPSSRAERAPRLGRSSSRGELSSSSGRATLSVPRPHTSVSPATSSRTASTTPGLPRIGERWTSSRRIRPPPSARACSPRSRPV